MRRDPRSRLGLAAVVAFVVGTVAGSVSAQIAATFVGYRPGPGRGVPLAVTVGGLLGLWAGLMGGVIFASRISGAASLGEDFGLRLRGPRDVVVGVVAGVGTQVVLIPALYWPFERSDPGLRHRLESPAKADTAAIHGGWQIAVLFLFLVVGAPLVEELFFRGLVLRCLCRAFGPAVGVIGSAVLFGLAHFQLLQLPALILLGLVLASLARRTERLGPTIVAHGAFNAFTVLTLTLGAR